MTNLALRNSILVLASAVFAAGLTFAGGAFAQASNNNNGTGSSVLPPAAPGTNGRQVQDEPGKGSPINDANTNRPNSSQPCEPGSTANANSRTTTCMDPDGKKVTLPNEKGNSAK
jgi:hypothetical protein